MSDENNKLVKTTKLGSSTNLGFGLKSKLNEAKAAGNVLDDISRATDKVIIIADDSGSMSGRPFQQEKKAIESFLKVCNPATTAVGITPMNQEVIPLSMLHTAILIKVLNWNDYDLGGTPMFQSIEKAIGQNPTRTVLISDGSPTDGRAKGHLASAYDDRDEDDFDKAGEVNPAKINPILLKAKEKGIKIDTVFIGTEQDETGIREMKTIAEVTGGLFIHFKEGETFANSFKYLAPAYYGMLSSGQIKL